MIKEEIIKSKKELKGYKYNQTLIQSKIEDLKRKKEKINKLTSSYEGSIKGSKEIQDKFADDLAEVLDITKEIDNDIKKLKEEKEKIEKKIDSIEQPYKNILYFRYIKGDSLTEVSNNIEKNYDYTRKLHRKALIKYGEIKDE